MSIVESAKQEVHVAVGVVLRQGRVLIARRPDHAHQGGLLEFPGGKVEPGETVQAALVREVREETGLQIPPASLQPVIGIRHDYGDKRVFLDVWSTDQAVGEALGREGQTISWLDPWRLQDDEFPAANRAIIRALQLPSVLAITGDIRSGAAGAQQLRRALENFPDPGVAPLVVLRTPGMAAAEYSRLAEAALSVCEDFSAGLLLHGAPSVYEGNPGSAGLHLPWHEARKLVARPVPRGAWLGVSCHSAAEMDHAVAIQADYVTLSPVKPTASHPSASALAWPMFRDLVARAPIPVFGLGGVALSDLDRLRRAGAQGVAGIRFWWP